MDEKQLLIDSYTLKTGALYRNEGICTFSVWAPFCKEVSLKIVSPEERIITMEKNSEGLWEVTVENAHPGTLYFYRLNNILDRPDPASCFQPYGVHGPSQVVDCKSFCWKDSQWRGLPLKDYIIYEVHVGTFTSEGTFDAAIMHLDYLKELGITAIEIMPVAQFPGYRNWGYDGVYLFAPQNSYGGPEGLKRFINACHINGIAVILDVVYNHLGPEGNYLGDFAPYFADKYKTPWGNAINFDGPQSDRVRQFFISNALYWIMEYHIDALRIDAIHGIFDFSAKHFLKELAEAVHNQAELIKRNVNVIAESDLNDAKVINPAQIGGYGLDAQWNDDFHHALHTLITGEATGYYQDFGTVEHLARAFREGFVYSGQYSKYRQHRHGNYSKDRATSQFIVFSQNHDQVGNRAMGDRLSKTQPFEKLKLAAAVVLLSPFIPLIFMGEEYSEMASFKYFVSHSDKKLIKAVRNGRRREFASFAWKKILPDPQAEDTFFDSKVNTSLSQAGVHKTLFEFYKHLIGFRKTCCLPDTFSKKDININCFEEEKALSVIMLCKDADILCIYSFNENPLNIKTPTPAGMWNKIIDSSSNRWCGTGETAKNIVRSAGIETRFFLNPYNALVYFKKDRPEG
jgi:maltooligosyltrehalose trehalohydrolase